MILSDQDLMERIRAKTFAINPLDETLIQPASIDLRLGPDFVFEDGVNERGTGFVQFTGLNHHARKFMLVCL